MNAKVKVKVGGFLWLEGLVEACCLHRVVILCMRSNKLLMRTGQCFLLNGFIFLGSIFVLNSVVIPALWWILPDQCSQFVSHKLCDLGGTLKFYSFLRLALIQLFYVQTKLARILKVCEGSVEEVTWEEETSIRGQFPKLCPEDKTSFELKIQKLRPYILYCRYNDIARYGYAAMGRSKFTVEKGSSQNNSPTVQNAHHVKGPSGLGGVMIGIGQQVYSILLLSVFFLEVYATGFIPYIGKLLNFLLLSWMYAYYCFEYKWNFNEVALDRRLDYFESYWPFFAGFGSPCVLAIFFFSPLVSYGIMAILFPLFVLTATGSESEQEISFEKHKWRVAGVGRLPIFYVADKVSMWMLSLLPLEKGDQDKFYVTSSDGIGWVGCTRDFRKLKLLTAARPDSNSPKWTTLQRKLLCNIIIYIDIMLYFVYMQRDSLRVTI
ncbi:Protein EI24 [Glycine max]|nr:Protein EI24 [Glycine max]